MVELTANGSVIDLPLKGAEIKYTKQVEDLFDLSKVSNSYSNSFVAPKTDNNTQTFEGLGLTGDTSTVPYSKVEATLKNHGFEIVRKGWLNISETSDNYKLSIIDGMIDFFKAIENKTLGVDLDLSNFEHFKDLPTVLASKNNEYYTYIFADYGGKNISKQIFPTVISSVLIDYQVPSFSVRKLFDLVFSTFGYTWESQKMEDFINELWITYPTPPTYVEQAADTIATLSKDLYSTNKFEYEGNKVFAKNERQWDNSIIIEGTLIDSLNFIIPETTGYKLNIKVEAYQNVSIKLQPNNNNYFPMTAVVLKNGVQVISFQTDPYAEVENEINIFLNVGDVIAYELFALKPSSNVFFIKKIAQNKSVLTIKKVNQGDVSPENAFKSFKIIDFFKEILWRTGLTPIIKDKHIKFEHIDTKLDLTNAVNWSDKFIKRKKETYIKNSYAQRNYFKMKYNDEQSQFNDGVIKVNNENIESEKTLAQSVFYSPENSISFLENKSSLKIFVPILKMYQSEVIESEGSIETTYKTLENRFYFLRKKNVVENLRLKSIEIPAQEDVSDWNFANIENTILGELVNKNFKEYEKIFQNFRCHEIELNLSLIDIINLDFTRPYYLEKESAYYILNKISFQEGETSIGEFIKINK